MNHKEVRLYFGDCFAGVDIELHDTETFSIALTEYEKDEEKSSENHDHLKIRFDSEVFVGSDEVRSIIKALQYLLDENDAFLDENDAS